MTDPILDRARELRAAGKQIPLDIAFHLVDIAADQKGRDYVYPRQGGGCQNYFIDPETGQATGDCLIGRVFEFFVDYNDRENRCSIHSTATSANKHYGMPFAAEARDFLQAVQGRQDDGMPWGEAIDRSKAQSLELLPGKE